MSRLLKILTQALQSSGVDMSQACVAVQIELGKRSNYKETVPTPAIVVNKNFIYYYIINALLLVFFFFYNRCRRFELQTFWSLTHHVMS